MRYLLSLLVFLSVSLHAENITAPAEQQMQLVYRFISEAALLVDDKSSMAIRAIAPVSKETRKQFLPENALDDHRLWTSYLFEFEGLIVEGIESPDGRFFLQSLFYSDPKWLIPLGLNVGSSLDQVQSKLGKPKGATPQRIEYEGESQQVTFELQDNKVRAIQFTYYVD